MLVLTRKAQEKILIGEEIVVTVIRIQGKGVRIGIEAPREIPVRRAELVDLSDVDLTESECLEALAQRLGGEAQRHGGDAKPPSDRGAAPTAVRLRSVPAATNRIKIDDTSCGSDLTVLR